MEKNDNLISIIIPVFGNEKYFQSCINAIQEQENNYFECIIVIDGPDPKLEKIANNSSYKTFILEENKGPAYARNYGAEKAEGDILFFVDSDMVLYPNAIDIVYKKLKDKKIKILQGMYEKIPANPNFITNFIALKKWIDFDPENTTKINSVGSELLVIRKRVFEDIGGFDINFRNPTVEDYELGHRLRKKHDIFISSELKGRHFFPKFFKIFRNYYIRSREWGKLYYSQEKREFDNGATNKNSVYSSVSLVLLIGALIAQLLFNSFKIDFGQLNPFVDIVFYIFYLISVSVLIFCNLNYLKKYRKTYGVLYSFKVFFILLTLYLAIFFGGLNAFISSKIMGAKPLHLLKCKL